MSHVVQMKRPRRMAITADTVTIDREALAGVLRLLMQLIQGRPFDRGEQGMLLRTTLRLSLIVYELLQDMLAAKDEFGASR